MNGPELRAHAESLRAGRTPFVLATVVRAQRPTSAKPGDCALVLADGTIEGFVGGACAESTVRAQGLRLLSTGESTLLRITPGAGEEVADGVVTVANPCLSGGELEIFLDAQLPPPLVVISGSGPIARALDSVGPALGYDTRLGVEVTEDTSAVVVASHGNDEERVLAAALDAGVGYIGLIASRTRGAAVLQRMGSGEPGRIHTPAGLAIGAATPAEIAVSVYAELIANRPGPPPTPVTATTAAVASVAVDPVCGMSVPTGPDVIQLTSGGRRYHFCGTGCRDAFAADPGRYTGDA